MQIADHNNFDLRRRPRGFVLLVTLVLLTLAALAAVAVSRAALARVDAATEARIDLQRRWGTLSCQAMLLPQSERILHRAELQMNQPVSIYRRDLKLGDQPFALVFQDESAKANVAALIRRQGIDEAGLTIRRLSLGSPSAAGSVDLRFLPGSAGPECFGDVFDRAAPRDLFDHALGPAPAEVLTCWGDGRLNIHRASESVLEEICSGVLDTNQIHVLAGLQRTAPDISLSDALKQVQLATQKRGLAEQLLTDVPDCYSLWLICRTQRRGYWSLAVARQNQYAGAQVQRFEW